MTTTAVLSHLSNPLVTPEQLTTSGSLLDGIPTDLETTIRCAGARLTQAAGVLLQLPQEIIAQAIVIFTRFWIGTEGGSLREFGAKDVSAASTYMMAKLSAHPQSPRNVLNVYSYLTSPSSPLLASVALSSPSDESESYYLSEGTYHSQRNNLMRIESLILRILGFQTHVALPYTLAINYMQTLDISGGQRGAELAQRVFAHLNAALLSPQLLYLTQQPPALATAAIYLAAKEVQVKLPSESWWEVFDIDREDLGFLVVAMRSMKTFALTEHAKSTRRRPPLTVEDVEAELETRRMLDGAG
ncbi:MAG: hypothetical protein M1833_000802 [Piccolia ochrophora]|nr:MAG: hypothetical protein M1833_000802 [Piccolia ochrophora]